MKRSKMLALTTLCECLIFVVLFSPKLVGDEGTKSAAPKVIPLKSIYSTSRQEGLISVDQRTADQSLREEVQRLHKRALGMGASNVFLARGNDIRSAASATQLAFSSIEPVNEPVGQELKSDTLWLVAYLGVAGSNPPNWEIKSAEVDINRVRLVYTEEGSVDADAYAYFIWVPLGKLDPGTYTLELFDENQREVVLSRRVKVSRK